MPCESTAAAPVPAPAAVQPPRPAVTLPAGSDKVRRQTLADLLDGARVRLLADALAEGTAEHWRRRAAAFDDARPRSADRFLPADPVTVDQRCAAVAQACRNAAQLVQDHGVAEADVRAAMIVVDIERLDHYRRRHGRAAA